LSNPVTTIVRNCARMQLRKRPRLVQMPLDEQIGEECTYSVSERLADPRPSPEDACRDSELTGHLRKCTALLSPRLRRTFQLRVVDGLSIFATAQVLGLPHGTIKARLARARRKLARYIAHTVVIVTFQAHNSRAFGIGLPTGSFPWSLRVWFSIACAACVRRLPCLSSNSLTHSL
jgi:predicted RNA polymerase sigma factor